jgi:hypothetical protein
MPSGEKWRSYWSIKREVNPRTIPVRAIRLPENILITLVIDVRIAYRIPKLN